MKILKGADFAIQIQHETGIHATTISRILHNKLTNIGLDTIEKLCDVLDCRIQELLEYVRENK